MCGIAGMMAMGLHREGLPEESGQWLDAMKFALGHRGPDDTGTWMHPNRLAGFCHSRLSIIDLSERGHQPMSFADGDLVIAYNGEIYNFRELKKELQQCGYKFRSSTDTEVVLAAVHRWGIKTALERFVGMFAFALWDGRKRTLYLARDRLGEKPLFVSCRDGFLYFASELKSLLRVPALRGNLSMEALWTYLKLGYIYEPLSIVEGIYKLPPAHYLTVEYGNPREVRISTECSHNDVTHGDYIYPERYWNLQEQANVCAGSNYPDSDDCLQRLDELLRDAIRGQMQCDVPYGVFLSGGIDSTIVAAYLQSESALPVHTFTVRFDDPDFDEGDHASRVAGHIGTEHHEFYLTENNIIDQVPFLSRLLDEPTANASVFAARLIAELARESVKVCLSGDGGDEGFAGYNRYLLMHNIWNKVRSVPGPVRRMLAAGLSIPRLGFWSWLESLQYTGPLQSRQSSLSRRVTKFQGILKSANVVQAYESLVSVWPKPDSVLNGGTVVDLCWPEPDGIAALAELVRWDLMTYLPGDNLAKLDRASMSASLEMRLPLLDHRIIEFGYGLPSDMKIQGGETKWLLKQLLNKILPQELVTRPKMGFTAPVERWLRGPLREWSMDLLTDSVMVRDGYLVRGEIESKVDSFRSRGIAAQEIWSLAVLHSWYEGIISEQ